MIEGIIIVTAVGLIAILNIVAFRVFHRMIINIVQIIMADIIEERHLKWKGVVHVASKKPVDPVIRAVREEGKKTRKETQEMKTRLTQVRKDMNKLQKVFNTKALKQVLKLLKDGARK